MSGLLLERMALEAGEEQMEMSTKTIDEEFRKGERLAVSLKTLAAQLDTTRTSVEAMAERSRHPAGRTGERQEWSHPVSVVRCHRMARFP